MEREREGESENELTAQIIFGVCQAFVLYRYRDTHTKQNKKDGLLGKAKDMNTRTASNLIRGGKGQGENVAVPFVSVCMYVEGGRLSLFIRVREVREREREDEAPKENNKKEKKET
jgi:hypothetical protein